MNNLDLTEQVFSYLSPRIQKLLTKLQPEHYDFLEEIRLRCHQPLVLKAHDKEFTVTSQGDIVNNLHQGYRVTEEDINRIISTISDNSFYAFEEDIKRGFITIPGGHRVGLAGNVVTQADEVKAIKEFSGLCFRIARQVKDCAVPIINHLYKAQERKVNNTLVISPPRCGKTTLLRDIARLLSAGYKSYPASNVVIIDERSEIAGSYRGIPQLDVGIRTDVLDSCPKAIGMIMAIRSLSPQVIIADEIGRKEDVEAIQECINAGVTVIASIHAGNIKELLKRPAIKELIEINAFKLGILLARDNGPPGLVKQIIRWD